MAGLVTAAWADDQLPDREWTEEKAKLLVAADPDSMSGKAKLARDYGIPIVNEEGLERLVGIGT